MLSKKLDKLDNSLSVVYKLTEVLIKQYAEICACLLQPTKNQQHVVDIKIVCISKPIAFPYDIELVCY